MLRGYGAQQIRAAEAPHLAAGEPLMARAAAALAEECERALTAAGRAVAGARVAVLVGGGNNGGDALYAAAALAGHGARVELVRTSERVHEEGLAAALAAGASAPQGPPEQLAARAAAADLVVDGILGTGTSPDPRLRGPAREIVAALAPMVEERRSRVPYPSDAFADVFADVADRPAASAARAQRRPGVLVVAVDIPSGIHPDTGAVPDPAAVLRADVTVTFGGYKAGLLLQPARGFAGGIRLVDIGLGPELAALTPLVELPD
ncbi:MAG TPA: NAD(P)H-hydrate epimerase [Gryllotalpicola sp.]